MSELEATREGARLTVRLNRPQALNALTPSLLQAATEHVRSAAADDGVRVVVLTGAGRAFCAGADLIADRGGDSVDSGGDRHATIDAGNALVAEIVRCPKPVVAGLNGVAAGMGATIALACDLHVMRSSAYLLLAFANIGLMPDGGATAIVPALVGRARAARMSLLAERIPAAQALDWGLVSHVAEDDAYDAELEAVVAKLAAGPTLAYARTKAALAAATLADLEQAHAIERAGQDELFDTEDVAEGFAAFRERRRAEFRGR